MSVAQDGFYTRFGVKFYKDRHWLRRECPELMPPSVQASPLTWCPPLTAQDCNSASDEKLPDVEPSPEEVRGKLFGLEAGCGCGSAAFPLLRANDSVFLLACDFSSEAISLMKARDEYDAQLRSSSRRVYAWVCDLAAPESDQSWKWLEELARQTGGLDFVTMVYVLSAIDQKHMRRAVRRLAKLLKIGGLLFFRDYAAGDMAQSRFDSRGEKNVTEQGVYTRGEGTLAHYFTKEEVRSVFEDDGLLEAKEITLVERDIKNRKLDITMHRIWMQAKFVRREEKEEGGAGERTLPPSTTKRPFGCFFCV